MIEEFEDISFESLMDDGFSVITEEIHDKNEHPNEEQESFPILPVKNMVMFPNVVIPITAGRGKSIKLLEDAYNKKEFIGVICQKNSDVETPKIGDLNSIGTISRIIKIIKLPNGNITAITRGVHRFRVKNYISTEPFFRAEIQKMRDSSPKNKEEFYALIDNIKDLALKIIELDPNIPNAANFAIKNIDGAEDLLNFICVNGNFSTVNKQKLLEEKSLSIRARKCYELLQEDFKKLELRNKIHQKTTKELDKHQREYFLNQQIKTIQEELGGGTENDIEELKAKAKKIKWSEEIENHFNKEINRLQRHNPNSPDYNVQRNYLDFFTDLPWENYTKDTFDLPKAEAVLNRDHFGLEDIKKRVLEHMAVLKLKNNMKSPILCLVGPPGVGKTSLGKSVADALGRKYIRLSLGGLHDESEIRGHRKTYIGAMAGRILQSIKKAGTSNPVIVLDEIDKLGTGTHGDPSSALLEVLDPEQNNSFYDNYLEKGKVDRSANPTPGNKKGGLSNIVEKAMGSIAKSGSSPIVEVLSPGEIPTKKGLIFAATPASDIVCGPSQLASGIGLQVFMTGRGTPYGLAISPVIKVSSRNNIKNLWSDLIDVNAGTIATGEATIQEVGTELFNLIIDVASGRKKSWAELYELHNDLCFFNPAPIT